MKKISAFRPRTAQLGLDPFFNEVFNSLKSFDRSFDNGSHIPATNIKETDKGFDLSIALPGYTKDQIDITVKDGLLTISAAIEIEDESKNENFRLREFRTSSFKRSFKLNDELDVEKIEAQFTNGVLELKLEKKSEVLLEPKRIQIA